MKSEMDTPDLLRMVAGRRPYLLNETTSKHIGCDDSAEIENKCLVESCIQGDQRAWEEFTNKYKRLIFSIPMITCGARPEDAADVFQAVCIDVLNGLVQLKNVRSLRSWLITVTLRHSYRWKRKQKNHLELDAMEPNTVEEIATVPPTDQMAQLEQEQIVRQVVAKLPPRQQELVRLLFFEQPPVPYAVIAKRLGLATGSIGLIRARCLQQLRVTLIMAGFLRTIS